MNSWPPRKAGGGFFDVTFVTRDKKIDGWNGKRRRIISASKTWVDLSSLSLSPYSPRPPSLSSPYLSKKPAMLLYEDVIAGDEMFSDAFPMYVQIPPSAPPSVLTSAAARRLTASSTRLSARWSPSRRATLTSVRFPRNFPYILAYRPRTGANPSAEEGDESLEDGAVTVNNVVHSFRLQATSFDKKSYLTYLKVSKATIPSPSFPLTVSCRAT